MKFERPNEQDTTRVLITAFVFLCVAFLYFFQTLQRFELVTYDSRFILKGTRPTDPAIVVVEISDDSVKKIGRWPWTRDWHATLIKILDEMGAKAIVFDVVFSEKSDPQNDVMLATAIKTSGKVYLAEVVQGAASDGQWELLKSHPGFSENARGGGHINLQPDVDGVMRRIPLVLSLSDTRIPQLSFAVALDLWKTDLRDVSIHRHRLEIFQGPKRISVPLDSNDNFIINWTGRWQESFTHFSYIDLVSSYAQLKKGQVPQVPLNVFKDKICFVGTTASGLYDIRPTPLEPSYPAVGVNLTILDNLMRRQFITVLSWPQNLLILFLLAIFLYQILRLSGYLKVAFLTIALVSGYSILAVLVFKFFDVWINLVYSWVLIFATYFSVTLYNQLSIAMERTKLLKLATRDSLTGLYNVGHFKLLLKAELATISLRREKKLSLLMADVDNFKNTNDVYGHVTGDGVLREVATAIKNNCRALDVAARYGGEEFILMLPGANADEGAKVAEKIRKSVNEKVFFHEKGDFNTGVSLGVTRVSPDDKDIEVIVARVDRALYEAKRAGKNRVVIASDSPAVDLSS